jgi:hypothetical protein
MTIDLAERMTFVTDFLRFVRKPFEEILFGDILLNGGADETGMLLPHECGIDALLTQETSITGMSVRIHYGKNDHAFAFRKPDNITMFTEYAEFLMRRAHGTLTPDIHIQAYLNKDRTRLRGAAVARTVDIYRCIVEKDQASLQSDNYVVGWDSLHKNRMWIQEIK